MTACILTQTWYKATMRRTRTRTADQSSLFSFSFIAKKRLEVNNEEADDSDAHAVEPVATASTPLSVRPQAQHSSPQLLESVNPQDSSHPDDIGAAVSWPGGSIHCLVKLKAD